MFNLLLQLLLFSVSNSSATDIAIVNGGYKEETNYSKYRDSILTFYHYLADEKAKVFSAGGKDSLFIKVDESSYIVRKDSGEAAQIPGDFTMPVTKAGKGEVTTWVSDAAKNSNPTIFIAGDHGSPEGMCLWEGTDFPFKHFKSLQDKFPDDKMFRSVHLHCNAGAMIVDMNRLPPTSLGEWPKYLKKNFRKNSCSLAASEGDESWVMFAGGIPYEKTPWKEILKKPVSIASIYDALSTNDKAQALTKVTSDYLVEDLRDYFCKQLQKDNASSDNSAHDSVSRTHESGVKACSSFQTEVAALEKLVVETEKDDEYASLKATMAMAMMLALEPEKHKLYKKTKEDIDELTADLLLEEHGKILPPERYADYESKLSALRVKYAEARKMFTLMVDREKYVDEMNKYFKSDDFKRTMDKAFFKNRFPHLLRILKKDPELSLPEVREKLQEGYDAAQLDRKNKSIEANKIKRAFVEAELGKYASSPEGKILKEYYDSIRKCETSPMVE